MGDMLKERRILDYYEDLFGVVDEDGSFCVIDGECVPIAKCDDADDAEMIASALNTFYVEQQRERGTEDES